MAQLNIFKSDGFSSAELSDAINVIPNQFGRAGELNIFPDKGVRTPSVSVEYKNGVLNLLETAPRGAPGTVGKGGKRQLRTFEIPHIPHLDSIKAADIEGIRAFGSETELMGVQEAVIEKLADMRAKHDITREHMRMGALKGDILDADGSSILNLFTEFAVTEKVIDFDFVASDAAQSKTLEVMRHIEDNLMGDVMSGVRSLCSPEFFDNLISEEAVKRAWDNWQGNSDRLGIDPRKGFQYNGVTYEEYRGSATVLNEDNTTTVRKFIPAGEARFYPEGTRSTFRTFNAPATFMSAVNTKGRPFYASQKIMDHDLGVEIFTQSNPLPLCLRPAVLVKGTST